MWSTHGSDYWFDDGTIVNVRIEFEKWEDVSSTRPVVGLLEDDNQALKKPAYSLEVR